MDAQIITQTTGQKPATILTQEEITEFESYNKIVKNGDDQLLEDDADLMGAEQEEDEEESISSNEEYDENTS